VKLKEIGEFGLIERIAESIDADKTVIQGIGDDAAVIKSGKRYLLFSSDMLVEGAHFTRKKATPFQVGHKALGSALSDIAAMGGTGRYALISLGLPAGLEAGFVHSLYSGMRSVADRFGVSIVGGDTVSSGKIVIDVAVIGEAGGREITYRSGARRGDVILVTGRLGGSIERRHLTFTPRLREARFLVKHFRINSMIDISDGFSSDMSHICTASGVGAKVYESLLPVSKGAGSLNRALDDGEDFELLFTVPAKVSGKLIPAFRRGFGTPLNAVGEIVGRSEGIKLVDREGRMRPLKPGGFRHF
jgi:thiamine-monophosphate kinase